MKAKDILDAIGNTPLVGLPALSPAPGVSLFAKLEGMNPTGSMKDRIALKMVEEAEKAGDLTRERIVLEPTSGNTGIALAMVCKRKGYRLTCVMPDNVSIERRQILEMFGADMVFSPGAEGSNGAIRLAQEMAADPKYHMLYQYGNPANPLAHYETTAPEILKAVPDITAFVAGLGTGGTLMGVSRRLKEHDERIQVFAAEPDLGDLIQGLRNLDEGFVPPILDLALIDKKFIVPSDRGILFTQELLKQEGIFAGVSSGAALSLAVKLGHTMERGNIVVLLADHGWKYLSTQLWDKTTEEAADALSDQLLW